MNGKKVLAFICSILILGNQIPFSFTTSFAEENTSPSTTNTLEEPEDEEGNNQNSEPIEITLPNHFANALSFDKMYDGTTDILDTDLDLSKIILEGVSDEDRDKVLLQAVAKYASKDAGDTTVTISEFQLVFSDEVVREKYVLSTVNDITIPARIEKRKVCIKPSTDIKIVDNSPLPESVPFEVMINCGEHTENYVLDEDKDTIVNTDAALKVKKNEDGSLNYFFADGESIKTGNNNYEFVLHDDESVQPIPAEEMQITSAVVSKNKATVLEQNDNGIYSNGSVFVEVTAESSVGYENVKFILSAKSGEIGYLTTSGYHDNLEIEHDFTDKELKKIETVTCKEITKDENGKDLEKVLYKYVAKFELSLSEDENVADYSNLTCVIDNGTKSETNGLELTTDNNEKKNKVLIIDKKAPIIKSVVSANHGDGHFFDFSGNFVDNESGIREIKWRWDSDLVSDERINPWESKGDISHKVGDVIDIYDSVGWNDPRNVGTKGYNHPDGHHYLEIVIIDNVGNEYKSNYTTNGSDSKAPIVTYINLTVPELSAWESIINFLSFGTFVNKNITLTLKVIDESEDSTQLSGVKSVELFDGKDENAILLDYYKPKVKDNKYIFTLGPDTVINDWYVKLTDNNNNSKFYALSELLKDKDLSVEESAIETTTATDENGEVVTETTTTGIDWSKLESNKWVFDNQAPVIAPLPDDKAVLNNGVRYYNNNYGDFSFRISDDYALSSWNLYLYSVDPNGKETLVDSPNDKYIYETSEYTCPINTEKLSTGWYKVKGTASDQAGNVLEPKQIATFYVDHEEPSGTFEIISPTLETFTTEENWIKERNNGSVATIKCRFYVETKGSALNTATIHVNGNGKQKDFVFYEKDLIVDADKSYVEFEFTPDDKSNLNAFTYNQDHTYDFSADIITYAGNPGKASYKLHVDTDTPTVDKFIVEKNNDAVKNILNILSFGVFFNDSIKLTVEVSDVEYDSGIDHVEINYTGLSEGVKMTPVSNGKYVYHLPLDTNIFQSEIVITVYDKTDKVNSSCPNIQNTEDDKSTVGNHFVMLENVPPTLIVDLPAADSTERNDNQIWYRKHINTDENSEVIDHEKLITVTVQDKNSGINHVQMLVNGSDIIESSGKLELNGRLLPTAESTAQSSDRNTTQLTYQYSIEEIAKFTSSNDDGSYIIEFNVVDNAGNVTSIPVDSNGVTYANGKIVFYRDTISPTITQFSFNPATVDEVADISEFIDYLEYGFYFKRDFVATATIEDEVPSSGLDKVLFKLIPYSNGQMQEEESYSVEIKGNQATYTVRAGFKGQIYATAYDKVGNESEEKTPQAFVSDENAPSIVIEPLPEKTSGTDNNGNKLYDGQVQFKVTITDKESGLRTVSYSKKSEKDSFDAVITEIGNRDGLDGNTLTNGWVIEETDVNLITVISQVFTFTNDDNDISLTFNAIDRSKNSCEPESSEPFTIDTIAPQISISNATVPINDMYYQGKTEFSINITERNFDQELIIRTIENSFTDAKPTITFNGDGNSSSHNATVEFPEGDYTFSLFGSDLAGHKAVITFNGENVDSFYKAFNVDDHAPIIKTNFGSFGSDDDMSIYFNAKQTAKATITVTEHNFYAGDMGLLIEYMGAGSAHSKNDWKTFSYFVDWKDNEGSDVHSANITLDENYVYRITMKPHDRANNTGKFEKGSADHTPVFEVDKEIPKFTGRNDIDSDGGTETTFYVMYSQANKTAAAPSVSFDDINFDRIEYEYAICTPQYTNGYELLSVAPITNESGKTPSVNTKKFELTTLQKNWKSEISNESDDSYKSIPDGVYVVTFTAVDKAGNRSEPINASYFRMVNTDVLAYIYNSEKDKTNSSVGSGFYSLMNDKGMALSKKATDFQDLDILVIKPVADEKAGILVLREDEKEYFLKEYANFTVDRENVSDTAVLEKMHIPGSYFSDTFKDDGIDTRMELSVSVRDGVYQWLGSIHIDNEIPKATLPDDFKNWHNYFFEKETTITITDISEPLNDKLSKVFECPRNGERVEIPHSYDPESGTYSFTLSKGIHHIDITLVDEAGNEWNIERVRYVRVGNFRLYLGGGIVIAIGIAAFFIFKKKKRF